MASSICNPLAIATAAVLTILANAIADPTSGLAQDRREFMEQRLQQRIQRQQQQRERQEQFQQQRRQAYFQQKILESGEHRVTVSASRDRRCQDQVGLRLTTPNSSLFANGQQGLISLWPQIQSYVFDVCPEASSIDLEGRGGSTIVYRGAASAADGWQLTHQETPLQIAMRELEADRATFETTRSLDQLLQKHTRVFGGADASDAVKLQEAIASRKYLLGSQAVEAFEKELAKVPATEEGFRSLQTRGSGLRRSLTDRFPDLVPRLDSAIDARKAAIGNELLPALRPVLDAVPRSWRDANQRLLEISALQDKWGREIPAINDEVNESRTRIASSLEAMRPVYEAELASLAANWQSVSSVRQDREVLVQQARNLPNFEPFLLAANTRYLEILTVLEKQSQQQIEEFRQDDSTVEETLTNGLQIAETFKSAGEREAGDRLLASLAKVVDAKLNASRPIFEAKLSALAATPENRKILIRVAEEFSALELQIPAYGAYRAVSLARAKEIDDQACAQALAAFGSSDMLDDVIALTPQDTTLQALVCKVSAAGGKLEKEASAWGWISSLVSSDVPVNWTDRFGDTTRILLSPTKRSSGLPALAGRSAMAPGGPARALSAQEWNSLATEMTTASPTGEPDSKGITDCDRLAGDPNDPRKVVSGVEIDPLNVDSRVLARGLEACTAAVEYNNKDPRQLYQLARLVWAASDYPLAAKLISPAVAQGYPAALFLSGQLRMQAEGDEYAYVDAYHLYKRAADAGHAQARTAALEINPDNIDLFSPISPPTEADVRSTLPNDQCVEGGIFGAGGCIRFTGAKVKNCFQSSATDFWCEWQPVAECRMNGNALADVLMQVACRNTEFQFGRFRKHESGKWSKFND